MSPNYHWMFNMFCHDRRSTVPTPSWQSMSQLNDKIVDACSREKSIATLSWPQVEAKQSNPNTVTWTWGQVDGTHTIYQGCCEELEWNTRKRVFFQKVANGCNHIYSRVGLSCLHMISNIFANACKACVLLVKVVNHWVIYLKPIDWEQCISPHPYYYSLSTPFKR